MTEVTQVPLQPVKKGSLVKLWLGVALAVVLGAGLAWLTVPAGVSVTENTPGVGPHPGKTDVVIINYTGKLAASGKEFDKAQNQPIPLGQGMIAGFVEGLTKMQKGGKYTLHIPAAKGYGAEEKSNQMTGEVVIPANSDLTFEIEVIDFMSEADFQRRMQMMQQLQQMQQQKGAGAEGGTTIGDGAPAAAPPTQ